jgi:hypothetical protein
MPPSKWPIVAPYTEEKTDFMESDTCWHFNDLASYSGETIELDLSEIARSDCRFCNVLQQAISHIKSRNKDVIDNEPMDSIVIKADVVRQSSSHMVPTTLTLHLKDWSRPIYKTYQLYSTSGIASN